MLILLIFSIRMWSHTPLPFVAALVQLIFGTSSEFCCFTCFLFDWEGIRVLQL
jgi:hypothetical protein